jgi:hypothetical protein
MNRTVVATGDRELVYRNEASALALYVPQNHALLAARRTSLRP